MPGYNYLEAYNIVHKNQNGFPQDFLTVPQVIQMVHDFASEIKQRGQTNAICSDMSNVLDRDSHDKFIRKFSKYDVTSNVLFWFQAYLSGPSQVVVICGVMSNTTCTIWNTSELHPYPVLFLCCINVTASNLHLNTTAR